MRIEVDVTDLAEVDIEMGAAEFQLAFADVPFATLEVDGPHEHEWSMEREGESLKVRSNERGNARTRKTKAALLLPKVLEELPPVLLLHLAACDFRGVGPFLAVDAEIDASKADFSVQATEARIVCAASKVRAQLEGVAVANFLLNAGSLSAWLKGTAPSLLSVKVAAGSASLIVPPVSYSVQKETALGKITSKVKERRDSPNLIDAKVEVGKLRIEGQTQPAPDF